MNTVEGFIDSPGTVYECNGRNDDGTTVEWCYYKDSAEEVRDLFDYEWCKPVLRIERLGATVVGCWFHCDDPVTLDRNEGEGNGCNAHNGCVCL